MLKRKHEKELEPPPNSIGIVGFKGGVGKTAMTVELSLLMARMKRRPSVIDWDPYNARTSLRILGKDWDIPCGAWNYVAKECDDVRQASLRVKVRREEGGEALELNLSPPTRRYGEITQAIVDALGQPWKKGRVERANELAHFMARLGDVLFNDFQVPSWMGIRSFAEIVNATSRHIIVVVDHFPQSFTQAEHLVKTLFPGKVLLIIVNKVPPALLTGKEGIELIRRARSLKEALGAKAIVIVPFDSRLYDQMAAGVASAAAIARDPDKVKSLRVLKRIVDLIEAEARAI